MNHHTLRATRLTLAILLLAVIPSFAAKVPENAWQAGILRDSSESWHSRTTGVINSSSGVLVGREYPIVRYMIEAGGYAYEADLVLKHKRDKQPAVTVNGPLKFAFIKSEFFIQDEQGKEFKLVLAKKTLKTQ